MRRRAVITGLGVFSPVGIGVDAYWDALAGGTSGVGPITRLDVGDFPVKVAAEVPEFKPRALIPKEHRKASKLMSWDVILGVVAALSAVEHSSIITEEKRVDPARLGISFGAGFITSDIDEMGQAFFDATTDGVIDVKAFGTEAMKGFFPLWLLKYLPNMPGCHVSIFCDTRGPNNTITSGDAASAQAIGEAVRIIERDAADVMICGGVDGKINPVSLVRYHLQNAASTDTGRPESLSRPFEKSRNGFVVGEGAASVIVEEYEHAKKRGATIYAEVSGYGNGFDAYAVDKIEPNGRGCRIAMQQALRDAKRSPDDVDAVFAMAKGSIEGDRAEARAINTVFGDAQPLVTSTKSMIGYVSAASGILEAVAAVGALSRGLMPPTINYDEPDPECPVNVVGNTAQEASLNNVLVNAGGFGGQFSALVLSKCNA